MVKPRKETEHPRGSRRSGQRSLGAAEGVLVALSHCSLDEAFNDIVQTAKRHNVAPLGLADALVAVAENDLTRDLDDAVVAAVGRAWGTLLSQPGCDADPEHAQQPQPTMTVCTSSGPPGAHCTPTVIEPIPPADEADIAEQARPVDAGIDEFDLVPDDLGENRDADAGDVLDQQRSVAGDDDDHPPAAGRVAAALVWPAWEPQSATTQRSFIDDMASRNAPYPPDWRNR